MKSLSLARLAVVAASLAVVTTSVVPASAHINDTAGITADQSVVSAGGLTISAIGPGHDSAASNMTGSIQTAAAVMHGRVNKLSLNPRRPCADPKAHAPGC